MPQDDHRETMSSLLATQTAIRVARDLGYPRIEIPQPPQPTVTYHLPMEGLPGSAEEQRPIAWKTIAESIYYVLIAVAIVLGIVTLIVNLAPVPKYP